ncbi:MAG: ABC transporter substrate-binding protein [Paracoccaceae bacterium]
MGRLKTTMAAALAAGTILSPLAAAAQELTFVSWQAGEPGYGDWWDEVVARFEADNPGVTVEMTKVARSEYADTMFTLFAGGNPPDIVHLAAFEYQPFAEEGFLEPLDPYIDSSSLDLEGWAGQETCVRDGQTFCTMLLYTAYVLAYNEAMLEAEGLDVPTSYDELMAAARAMTKDTDGDGQTDVFGLGVLTDGGANQMHDMLHFVLDAGGAWTTEGEPSFDTPGVIEGLRRYKAIVDEGLTPRDTPAGDLRQLWGEGRVAMRLDGPWIYNVTRGSEIEGDLKLAQSPLDPPVGGTSNVLAMPADADDATKDLVWAFIETATSAEMQQRFATLGSSPAPMPGLDYTEQEADNPNFALFAAANARAAAAGIDRLPQGLEVEFNEVAKIVFEEVQRMLIEGRSPEDTAAAIQAEVLRIKG